MVHRYNNLVYAKLDSVQVNAGWTSYLQEDAADFVDVTPFAEDVEAAAFFNAVALNARRPRWTAEPPRPCHRCHEQKPDQQITGQPPKPHLE